LNKTRGKPVGISAGGGRRPDTEGMDMLNPLRTYRPAGFRAIRSNRLLLAAGIALVVVLGAMTVRGNAAVPSLADFTVNLNPLSGRIGQRTLLVADKLTGNYSEVFTVAGANTFLVTGYWDAGQLVHDDGTIPYNGRESRLGVDYSLYALFNYSGTFTTEGAGGSNFQFTVTAGSLTLYADRGADTIKILPSVASLPIALTGNDEDAILASATVLAGTGRFHLGALDAGDFGLMFNPVVLTPLGARYFVAPAPFYTQMQFKGQFNSFDPSGNQQITGSADAWLQ
jgi:hypothetical protein